MANRNPIEMSADMFMCLRASNCKTDLQKQKYDVVIVKVYEFFVKSEFELYNPKI